MGLQVRTDFPGANACAVETAFVDGADVVRFAASPHGGTEALWFSLRVLECASRPVDLVLTNVDSCLGNAAQWDRVRPVVRQAGGAWERSAAAAVEVLADGRRQATWRVQPQYDSFEFAFCYPYGLGDVEVLRCATGAYWHLNVIGVTGRGRRLPRLANGGGTEGDDTPGVYLMARQHSGETPGSWVLDGLLRAAAERLDPAALLIWAAPLANLDGVVEGDYGKDPFPHDLNRAWTTPPMRHEVLVLQRDLARWAGRCRPRLVVDLHAPGATEDEGAYFFLPRAERPAESVAACRRVLEAVLPRLPAEMLHPDPARQPSYPSRWSEAGTVGVHVWETLGIPCLSMETPYSACRDLVLTRDEYRRLGAHLLEGIRAWVTAAE